MYAFKKLNDRFFDEFEADSSIIETSKKICAKLKMKSKLVTALIFLKK